MRSKTLSVKFVCIALTLAWLGCGVLGVAQTIDQSGISLSGIQPLLPPVPIKVPRPAQTPDAMWQLERIGPDGAPVSSFVDTIEGNDAAFEVVVGQGRLMTLKADMARGDGTAVIAIGDPSVVDFQVLPNPRMLRIIGRRAGVTDLSITTAGGQVCSFEVHVVYDLPLLRAQLKQIFPDAFLKLGQLREHMVVEGQARTPEQVTQIITTLEAYLSSVGQPVAAQGGQSVAQGDQQEGYGRRRRRGYDDESEPEARASGETQSGGQSAGGTFSDSQVINLIRVPGVRQVMLQVRIAELDRTSLREIGADILGVHPGTGNIWGSSIAGATVTAGGVLGLGGLGGSATGDHGSNGTAFGIFPSGNFEILLRALRKNSLLSIMAEPNLVALSGHQASFLAGGQFPVPVPQSSGGSSNSITVEWKDFGVQLTFVPFVLDDESIRMTVMSEVSTIDEALGTTLVVGGDPVPGVNARRTKSTVEMKQGQTLAMAGLLQVTLDATTSRIPGLGDLPYLGPLFSNTSHKRVEKELLILVTPQLVKPMDADQPQPLLPGEEITDPNDLEFYLLNRIAGRTCREHRSTTGWDDPLGLVKRLKLESSCVCGPVGFSE